MRGLRVGACLWMIALCSADVHAGVASPDRVGLVDLSHVARAFVAPITGVMRLLGAPIDGSRALPNASAIGRDEGPCDVQFPVRESGVGLYLEVRGKVRFESARIRFGDGSERVVPLHSAVRGRGLYALQAFDGPTDVEAVTVRARACSGNASFGVRLGR